MKWITFFLIVCMLTTDIMFFKEQQYFDKLSLLILFVSDIIYLILSQIYILAVFGVAESSIRIRILTEISKSGSEGITYQDLLKKYNKKVIIDKRLNRFLNSGELIYNHNNYESRKITTFSIIPALIFSFYWKLYRGS